MDPQTLQILLLLAGVLLGYGLGFLCREKIRHMDGPQWPRGHDDVRPYLSPVRQN